MQEHAPPPMAWIVSPRADGSPTTPTRSPPVLSSSTTPRGGDPSWLQPAANKSGSAVRILRTDVNKAKAAAFNERLDDARRRLSFDDDLRARLAFELEARSAVAETIRRREIGKKKDTAAAVVRRARAVARRKRFEDALVALSNSSSRVEDNLLVGFGFRSTLPIAPTGNEDDLDDERTENDRGVLKAFEAWAAPAIPPLKLPSMIWPSSSSSSSDVEDFRLEPSCSGRSTPDSPTELTFLARSLPNPEEEAPLARPPRTVETLRALILKSRSRLAALERESDDLLAPSTASAGAAAVAWPRLAASAAAHFRRAAPVDVAVQTRSSTRAATTSTDSAATASASCGGPWEGQSAAAPNPSVDWRFPSPVERSTLPRYSAMAPLMPYRQEAWDGCFRSTAALPAAELPRDDDAWAAAMARVRACRAASRAVRRAEADDEQQQHERKAKGARVTFWDGAAGVAPTKAAHASPSSELAPAPTPLSWAVDVGSQPAHGAPARAAGGLCCVPRALLLRAAQRSRAAKANAACRTAVPSRAERHAAALHARTAFAREVARRVQLAADRRTAYIDWLAAHCAWAAEAATERATRSLAVKVIVASKQTYLCERARLARARAERERRAALHEQAESRHARAATQRAHILLLGAQRFAARAARLRAARVKAYVGALIDREVASSTMRARHARAEARHAEAREATVATARAHTAKLLKAWHALQRGASVAKAAAADADANVEKEEEEEECVLVQPCMPEAPQRAEAAVAVAARAAGGSDGAEPEAAWVLV